MIRFTAFAKFVCTPLEKSLKNRVLTLRQDIVTVNHGYLLQKQWALQMLDSIDLFPGSGLLTGNIVHYPGNLEECLDVSDIPGAVKTGHWMLTLESTDIRNRYFK